MKLHHVGSIVDSIEDACASYSILHGRTFTPEKTFVSSQGVNVCFIQISEETLLELIEPVGENSAIAKLKTKGYTFYHLGYLVTDFDKTINDLSDKNFKHMQTFTSEAFQNKRCAFLYSPEMHLIEIIES